MSSSFVLIPEIRAFCQCSRSHKWGETEVDSYFLMLSGNECWDVKLQLTDLLQPLNTGKGEHRQHAPCHEVEDAWELLYNPVFLTRTKKSESESHVCHMITPSLCNPQTNRDGVKLLAQQMMFHEVKREHRVHWTVIRTASSWQKSKAPRKKTTSYDREHSCNNIWAASAGPQFTGDSMIHRDRPSFFNTQEEDKYWLRYFAVDVTVSLFAGKSF